jgi:ATP-dependent RNA helicase DDX49/DBP8
VFSLVVTPTRELAYQIAEQFRIIGAEINLKVCVVVGGMDMMSQAIELAKKPHIIIATPGRLVDHIQSSSHAIFFKRIKFLVLDEADRLLDSGFENDLSIIKGKLGPLGSYQSILVSATITKEIESMDFGDSRGEPFVFTSERYSLKVASYKINPSRHL